MSSTIMPQSWRFFSNFVVASEYEHDYEPYYLEFQNLKKLNL